MSQESNLYKAYKLAHSDRVLLIKKFILAIVIIVCFGLGSIYILNCLNSFSSFNLTMAILLWSIGVFLLPIFFLVFDLPNFLLWNLGISLAPFLFFLFKGQWNVYFFVIIGLVYLLLLISRAYMKNESNNLLELNLRRIVFRGSFFLLLALVLVLVSLVYSQNKLDLLEESSEKLIETIILQIESAQNIVNVESTGTIDSILKNYLEKEAINLGELDLSTLGAEEINLEDIEIGNMDKETLLEEMKANLSDLLDIPLTGEEKLSSLIVSWVKNYWLNISLPMKFILVIIIFISLMSILKVVNLVFYPILVFFSWVFLQILLSIKYLTIKKIGVEKQELNIAFK